MSQWQILRCCVLLTNSIRHQNIANSLSHVTVYRDTHCDAECLSRTQCVIEVSWTKFVMSQSTGTRERCCVPVMSSMRHQSIRTRWFMSKFTGTHTAMLCACRELTTSLTYHELNESCHSLHTSILCTCHELNTSSRYRKLNESCRCLQWHILRCCASVTNSMSHATVYRVKCSATACLSQYVIKMSQTQWVMSNFTCI